MNTSIQHSGAQPLFFKDEVKEALSSNQPVVALESTIISHGMPYPQNIETALEVEKIVRSEGAVPATIAVIDGKIRIGLEDVDFERVGKGSKDSVLKLSRRDLAYAVANSRTGATTVASTMICAKLAGIEVFATGGIGGVHRDGEKTLDISADLQELSKTRVAVVCAGVKSILDIGLTLEVLETLGVPVIGYQTEVFPAFYSRKSRYRVDYQMDELRNIAVLIRNQKRLGLDNGILVANPIPESNEIPEEEIESFIQEALVQASRNGIRGKLITPYLLSQIASKTEGRSLNANIELIKSNARVGAKLAKHLSLLEY